MNPADDIEEIVQKVSGITSESERNAYLDKACGTDTELRAKVEEFLVENELDATSFAATMELQTTDSEKSQIGPYQLLERIGEGGMGSVWVAQQSSPIRRKVAIKLIKAGMDSTEVLTRFEAERQALAMMDHPNIAKVLDGGVTDQGRPYFAMEYVKGVPLDQFCDQSKLSVQKRLELFLPICKAVQHAHQKGIIHRDLKPSNILVCFYDGKPVPKVIDFGLAKALYQSLTDKILHTSQGVMLGTPLYMSPEQAESDNLDVDTRTDVYSLGVILYELLTGSTPLEKAQLKQAAVEEKLRLIKDVDPPKPSTRISGSDSLASVAAQRGIDPVQLTRSLSGDLDWVIMKALEKDRSRRYETANGLAEDIRRHLANEPVSASPPSRWYRIQKFVRRNRAGVIAASLIGAALIMGIIGTSWGMYRAFEEGNRANLEATRAKTAAAEARSAEIEARKNAKQAMAATEMANQRTRELETLTDFQARRLGSIDVSLMASRLRNDLRKLVVQNAKQLGLEKQDAQKRSDDFDELMVGVDFTGLTLQSLNENIFAGALEAIDSQFSDQPVTKARLLQSISTTLRQLGLYELAEQTQTDALNLRKKELGLQNRETLISMYEAGRLYHDQRRYAEAETILRQALEGQLQLVGQENAETLDSMHWLGNVLVHLKKNDKAEPYLIDSLEGREELLGANAVDTLEAIHDLGLLRVQQNRFSEAEELYRKSIEGYQRKLGNDHPDTLITLSNMSALMKRVNEIEKAEQYCKMALEGRKSRLGFDHPNTLTNALSLGAIYYEQGRYQDAETELRMVYEGRKRVFGLNNDSTRLSQSWLRAALMAQNKLKECLPLLNEERKYQARTVGPEDMKTLHATSLYARTLGTTGKYREAEGLISELVKTSRRLHGDQHIFTLFCLLQLGRMELGLNEFAKAEEVFRESLAGIPSIEKPFPQWWLPDFQYSAQSRLGVALVGQQKWGEAEKELIAGYEGLLKMKQPNGDQGDTQAIKEALERIVTYFQKRNLAEPDKGFDAQSQQWQKKLVAFAEARKSR